MTLGHSAFTFEIFFKITPGAGDENRQSLKVRKLRIGDNGILSYPLTCDFGVQQPVRI